MKRVIIGILATLLVAFPCLGRSEGLFFGGGLKYVNVTGLTEAHFSHSGGVYLNVGYDLPLGPFSSLSFEAEISNCTGASQRRDNAGTVIRDERTSVNNIFVDVMPIKYQLSVPVSYTTGFYAEAGPLLQYWIHSAGKLKVTERENASSAGISAESVFNILDSGVSAPRRFNAGLAVNAGFVFNTIVKLYLGADAYFLDYLKQKTQTAHNKWQLSLGVAYIF